MEFAICKRHIDMEITKSYLDQLTYEINGAAIEVHKALGPGLLERIYHQCLMHELSIRNINFETAVSYTHLTLPTILLV